MQTEDARRSLEPERWGRGPRRAHSAAAATAAPAHTQPPGKEGAACRACIQRVSSPTAGDVLAPGLRAGLALVLLSTPHTGLLGGGWVPGGQQAGSPASRLPTRLSSGRTVCTSRHQAARAICSLLRPHRLRPSANKPSSWIAGQRLPVASSPRLQLSVHHPEAGTCYEP